MEWFGLVTLLIGWGLGIASHIVVEAISRRHRVDRFRATSSEELRTIAIRYVWLVWKLESRIGGPDSDLARWLSGKLVELEGASLSQATRELAEKLKSYSEEQMTLLRDVELVRATGDALGIKPFGLPYLSSQIQLIPELPLALQLSFLEVLSLHERINHEIAVAESFFLRTFDSSLTPENHGIIKDNLISSYQSLSKRARQLVDEITNARALLGSSVIPARAEESQLKKGAVSG
ncbi:MAG: hypothetical protein AB1752_11035 [Candidatus Zixiibacteriota bacterium]